MPNSFADYFIINEFTCNYDAGWLSTYIYKDADGRFRMCIWDFNSACDNYQQSQMDSQHFEMQNCLWYFMLMKDEDFTELCIKRYRQLRKTVLSESISTGILMIPSAISALQLNATMRNGDTTLTKNTTC